MPQVTCRPADSHHARHTTHAEGGGRTQVRGCRIRLAASCCSTLTTVPFAFLALLAASLSDVQPTAWAQDVRGADCPSIFERGSFCCCREFRCDGCRCPIR
jgi:hypothetical protein